MKTDLSHTQKVYGDEYFEGGKDGYPDYLLEKKLLINRGKTYGKLVKKYREPGYILDVGSAAGFILKGFMEEGWKGEGLEPNAKMAAYGQNELNLSIANMPVELFESEKFFDLITMIQVLPHFFDLKKGLEVLSSHTKPGGYWLIETWNRNSLTAKIMKESWHEYSPPSVLHWFTPQSLTDLCARLGFHFVAKGKKIKYINTTHAKTLLAHSLQSTVLKKLVSTLVPGNLTLPYPSEDLFWILLKKEN
ncbi:MAG: class I SAM-dependent methyltransferase [Bacteroidia bacterium]|nr:class I SAM-dependent methyltransferase [Bacteroidia bacterium]